MPHNTDKPKYFIVKHGLDDFKKRPSYIWRSNMGADEKPHRFNEVRLGDRWVAFAYTTSDKKERPLSFVTGFYECVSEACFGIPPAQAGECKNPFWFIEGKPSGEQPMNPVGVRPIDEILGVTHWKNQAIVPITAEEFNKIRQHTDERKFDPKLIPLLGRYPENEQEVLSVVVSGHKQFGIEKIIRVQTAFPDMLVQLEGSSDEVHLELEVCSGSFLSHGHKKQMSNRCFTDNRPVAVLCWSDDDENVKSHVHKVFELQSLIRKGNKIVW